MYWVILISLTLVFSIGNSQKSCEQLKTKEMLDTCHDLYSVYKLALIKEPSNLYALKRAFFYSPSANPVLLKVNYNITYNENISLPDHGCPPDNDGMADANVTNTTHIYGWTSSGVYALVHPFLVTILQFQFPFSILRALESTIFRDHPHDPYWDALLWKSGDDLSSVLLELEVESLPCMPTVDQIAITLYHITELLHVFAAGYNLESGSPYFTSETRNLVGFALNQTSLDPSALLQSNNDGFLFATVIVLCNTFVMLPMWAVVVFTRPLIHSILVSEASKHRVSIGVICAGFLAEFGLVLSCVAELVMSAVWTANNSGTYVYLCVWVRLIFILIYLMGPLLIFVVRCIAGRQSELDVAELAIALFLSQIVYIFIAFSIPTFLYFLVFPTAIATIILFFVCVSLSWSIVPALQVVLQDYQERNANTSGGCSKCWNRFMLNPALTVFAVIYLTLYTMILFSPMAFGRASVKLYGFLPLVPLCFLGLFIVLLWIILKLNVPSDSRLLANNENNTSHRAPDGDRAVESRRLDSNGMGTTFASGEQVPLIHPRRQRHGYNDNDLRHGSEHATNFDSEGGELYQSCTSARDSA